MQFRQLNAAVYTMLSCAWVSAIMLFVSADVL